MICWEVIFAASGGERWLFLESARGLRAPGPCAYFWPAPTIIHDRIERS